MATDDRFEDSRSLAGVHDIGRRQEQLLDLLGVAQHHERRLAEHPDREARAVARAGTLQEGGGATPRRRASATRPACVGPGGSWLFTARAPYARIPTDEYIYLRVCVKLMPRGHFDRSTRRAETRARLLQAAAEVYALPRLRWGDPR